MSEISVIMTVYNTPEDYLKAAVESILNQSFKDFEFIIIDDCSKKNPESIISSYNDSRIIFVRNKENLGVNLAPNVGLKIAKGKYIFRMDSDDIAHPDRLQKQKDFLDKNPQVDVLGTAFEKFPKLQVIKYPQDDEQIKYTMRFLHNAICNPSVAIRKSSIDELNMKYSKEDTVCEDYGMWLRYIDKLTFANLDEVLLNYRWHKNNISKKRTLVQSTGAQILMFEAQSKYFGIDANTALEAVKKFADNKIITSCDIQAVNDFVFNVKSRLDGKKYEINRTFYKSLLKKCVRDIKFISILFSKQTDEIIKLSLMAKIAIAFGL